MFIIINSVLLKEIKLFKLPLMTDRLDLFQVYRG